jgi:Acetyltransferase (GNAT) domain
VNQVLSDKESYLFLCENEMTIPLCMKPDWLDAVCGNDLTWDVVLSRNAAQKIEAALVFCLTKRYGFTQITMPPFTQFTGFWFWEDTLQSIDNQQVIARYLLGKLPKAFRTTLRFCVDSTDKNTLIQLGFDVEDRHTQVLHNIQNKVITYQNLSQSVQRNIKKANQYFRIETKDNFELFYRISNTVFERQNIPNPTPLSIWQSIHTLIQEKGWGRVYFSVDENGEYHAVALVAWDAKTMYLISNSSTDKGRKLGAMTQLIWHIIEENPGQVEAFSFLGSSIPAIETFNLRFKAENMIYFSATKYQNQLVKRFFGLLKK